jgi:2',3'-cyclic-nucleotide 2'-phosphodiesterase (5'-nucleotidase family)
MPFKFILPLLLIGFTASAKPVHILHTNDLHSYFNGYADGRGGYSRLKAKMDEIRAEFTAKGIETLTIDGGDFGEGTSYFLTGAGAVSLRMLGLLGVEASVIGNHDYMMGGPILARQIRAAATSTQFLSANLVTKPVMELDGLLKGRMDFVKNGVKISVVGLSTAEPHFQYPLLPDGLILPAIPVGEFEAQKARNDGAQLVIALTHLGVGFDKNLAKFGKGFDVIVGGHSHTRLEQPLLQKNKSGKFVPIVQAQSHGLAVGSLLVDVADDGTVSVLDYHLYDISNPMKQDPEIQQLVDQAVEERNSFFNGRFDEVIGRTETKLSGYENGDAVLTKTCWGGHMARMSRQAAGADVGLHLAQFEGVSKKPGLITLGDLIDNFPHIRKAGDQGWEVARFRLRGDLMKVVLKAIINLEGQMGVNFDGLTYRAIRAPLPKFLDKNGDGKLIIPFDLKIDGRSIENKKFYTVAMPAEIGYATKALLPSKVQSIFPGLENSGHFMWTVMENYVRAKSPIRCLNDREPAAE